MHNPFHTRGSKMAFEIFTHWDRYAQFVCYYVIINYK